MTWIYLSPHLDDTALSCGGLVSQQVMSGERVEIWTICAGDPPPGLFSPFTEEHHARWQMGREATASRRQEDLTSGTFLGATCRHLPVPDCLYRRQGLDYWSRSDPVPQRQVQEEFNAQFTDSVTVKGKTEPVNTYKVIGQKGAEPIKGWK